MDIFDKADMIREALPNRGSILVTGDCRVVIPLADGHERVLYFDDCPEDPQDVLERLLKCAHEKGFTDGKEAQREDTRTRLGL